MYSIQSICSVIDGNFLVQHSNDAITNLVYDSRMVQQASSSLFFALVTEHNNGNKFIRDAYKKGVRNFVTSESISLLDIPGSNVIEVSNSLNALQALAAFHRSQFHFPVIGITGSNGKTVIKEWLFQLLQNEFSIVRSPKSFNSQIGVPLSVWQIKEEHNLGLFEAGISKPGEMEKLEKVIRPGIGILTNIGEAHSAQFSSREEKMDEKMKLFIHSDVVIGEYDLIYNRSFKNIFTWGTSENSSVKVIALKRQSNQTIITVKYKGEEQNLIIPFTDDASVNNAIICFCTLAYLGKIEKEIVKRFAQLHAVDMRLQLKKGINNCIIINDSYSADITSFKIALDFLKQQSSGLSRTVILSEFFDSGLSDEELYNDIAQLAKAYHISKLIIVGERIASAIPSRFDSDFQIQSYLSTNDLLKNMKSSQFFNEIILIKGARRFEFERVAQVFEQKVHQTVLELNLNALAYNLKEFKKLLLPETKVMAMVKAFSYGSGTAEIAGALQYHNIDYLGVAYADEGVELVKSGITIPIMVMNTEDSSFQAIVDYNLQPVIYSFGIMEKFENYLKDQGLSNYPIHIEIETGMNRLGFNISETEKLGQSISASLLFRVQSVFSHLAASEDPDQDAFTNQQKEIFLKAVTTLQKYIYYPFLLHIANTAAIIRRPDLQFDMVRLGIGLYGIEIDAPPILELQPVATLRTTIAQLKNVKKGETISYNRKGRVERDSVIATVRIGYADGYSRQFGNKIGKMWINGNLAHVIGSVCMDMTMLDVTDIEGVKEGDEVVIFGKELPIQNIATWIHTIPYEIMTGISQRVKRVYFHE